jgi:hypothetical protein
MEQISAIAAKTQSTAMKISTTVTETKSVQVEKEITFPYYFKDKTYGLCCVFNSEHIITVSNHADWWKVQALPTKLYKQEIAAGEETTEAEFQTAYDNATQAIASIRFDQEAETGVDENEECDRLMEDQRERNQS